MLLKGFPKEVSEKIELPNIGELIRIPVYNNVELNKAYREVSQDFRNILDKIPLKNDKKYVYFDSQIQYLIPHENFRSVLNIYGKASEWHIDGTGDSPSIPRDRVHLLISECTARTEFFEEEVKVPLPEDCDLMTLVQFLNYSQRIEGIELKPKAIEPNRFVTFDNHVHRAVQASVHEFRYMLRVLETDREIPKGGKRPASKIFFNGGYHKNIEYIGDGIMIHIPKGV